jgi:hypothetical protein
VSTSRGAAGHSLTFSRAHQSADASYGLVLDQLSDIINRIEEPVGTSLMLHLILARSFTA